MKPASLFYFLVDIPMILLIIKLREAKMTQKTYALLAIRIFPALIATWLLGSVIPRRMAKMTAFVKTRDPSRMGRSDVIKKVIIPNINNVLMGIVLLFLVAAIVMSKT